MGMTVFNPSLPPLSCNTTSTLLPGATTLRCSKAFRKSGTIMEAAANDPVCKNVLLLIIMTVTFIYPDKQYLPENYLPL
jgi:hypothetical protein